MSLDEPPPAASLDDEWCTISAAARRLNVTPQAIRNRIKRGTLEVRPNGNFGRLVRVPATLPQPGALTPAEPAPESVAPTVSETVALLSRHIERLDQELAATREKAADRDAIAADRDMLKVQLDGLRAVIEAKDKHVAAVEAEREGLQAVLARADQLAGSLRADRDRLLAERDNRSWWRWRRLVGG